MATTTNNGWTIPAATDLVKNGYSAIDVLGQAIDTSVGQGLLAWQSYTPTLSGGWAAVNGTFDARYLIIGKTVHVSFQFTVGSSTTKGTTFNFNVPVPATARALGSSHGLVRFNQAADYFGVCNLTSTTNVRVSTFVTTTSILSAGAVTSTTPTSWSTGHQIQCNLTYEMA